MLTPQRLGPVLADLHTCRRRTDQVREQNREQLNRHHTTVGATAPTVQANCPPTHQRQAREEPSNFTWPAQGIAFSDRRLHTLKGVPDVWRLFAVKG